MKTLPTTNLKPQPLKTLLLGTRFDTLEAAANPTPAPHARHSASVTLVPGASPSAEPATYTAPPPVSMVPVASAPAGARPTPVAAPASTGHEAPAAAPPEVRREVFRKQALEAKSSELAPVALPPVGASRWALLLLFTTAFLLLLAVGYFAHVEVTSVATGALVIRGGPRPVLAQAPGQIAELAVRPGQSVNAGQQVARIDATELRAREKREEEHLELILAQHARLSTTNTRRHESTVAALQRKRALLAQRSRLKSAVSDWRRKRSLQTAELARVGAVSEGDALATREAAQTAQEELLLLRQQVADIDLELNDRKRAFDAEQEDLARRLNEAEASRNEAATLVNLTVVRAPVSGRVESLLVTTGQVVPTGAAIARIIPDGSVTSVVAFSPVKDAAFLRAGLSADVEFASLPVSEFGKARAKVTRVSNDVATREDIIAVLGATLDEAVVGVELEIVPGPGLDKVRERLRSGERLIARVNTRERRIITLAFDFLRKWYPW